MNITKRQHRAAGHAANLRRRALPLLIAGCFAGNILANPLGPQVVNGQASFVSQGNTLSITNTPGAIINWQNFSINPGELTRFLQQNPDSAVLNRVTGGDPSAILGALQSNGKVFLINPNGILFGQGAQVDVNGLIASTLHLSNEDFLLGRMNFQAGSTAGRIQNQGAITTPSGGQVLLIAPNVENSGIITSPKGEVLLAAGHTVQLVDSANPALHVVLSAPENEAINLGQIIAQGGKTGIYGALIHQRGIVNANSAVVGENGKIVFKASRDTILDTGSVTTATGEGRGGEIDVLGDRVGLAGGARVDASGKTGGGTVLVGGDYHGENAAVPNARRTYVGSGADIKADATDSGNGGKVIVWSDEVTRNHGNISARGGAQGGDGGFVESSGKQTLEHHAAVDVSAPKGKGGTLLLDPATITIVGGSGDGDGVLPADGNTTFQGNATAGVVNFADSDLTSAGISNVYQSELEGMAAGTNIVLEATDYIGAVGSFAGTVTLPSNSNLTMRTRNASGDGAGGINLVNSADSSNLVFQTQGTGTITLETGTGSSPLAATIDVGTLKTAGGAITVNASGNVVLRGAVTTPGGGNGGDISLTSGGYMTLGGAHIDARGSGGTNGNVTLKSGDAISLQTGKTIFGNQLKMTAATGIYGTAATDAMTTQVSSVNALNTGTGPIRISNSGSNLSISDIGAVGYGVKNLGSGGEIAVATDVGHTIDVHAPISSNNGAIYLDGLSGINVYASSTPEISSSGGAISLYSSNPDAKIGIAASTQINSGGGAINMTADHIQMLGAINAGIGNVTLMPSAASAIKIGSGANSANTTAGLLELGTSELANVATSGQLLIQGAGTTTLDTAGSLDLKTPGNLTGSLSLLSVDGAVTTAGGNVIKAPAISIASTSGTVTNNAQITTDSALTISSASGAVSNTGALTSVSGAVGLYSTSGTVSNTAAINAGTNVSLISTNNTLSNSGQVTAGGVVSLSGDTGGLTNSATLSGNQAILTAGSGALTNTGAINVTSSLQLNATTGDILNSNTLASSGDVTVSTPVGKFTNSGNITAAGSIFLTAQKMNLVDSGTPTINAGSGTGFVLLSSDSDIDLGSAVDTNPKLELSTAELGAIHTGILRIDSTGAGGTGINISTALTTMSAPVLDLVATGNVTQAAGATIDSVSSLSVKGASVNLPESNNVGIIAGTATTGDFVYRSLNQIAVDTVHAQSGITVSQNTGTIKLKSDTAGISQAAISMGDFAHPNAVWANGGGLVLEAAGDVKLINTNNNFGKLAVNLNTSSAGIGKSMVGTASNLDIASLTGVAGNAINGISTNNTTLELETSVADSGVTVSQAIAAGTGAVGFKTDGITLNNSVTASSVQIRPYSSGRPITVGSLSCNATFNGGCLTVTNLYKLVTPMVGIGTEDTVNPPGDVYVAGITVGGNTATDRNAATTRIGLLSGGGVSQAGGTAINVQDLGVRARGTGVVSLTNSGNAVTNLAGKTDGGSFSFFNGADFSVFNASGTVAGDTYSMTGVNAGTGTVQLTSAGAISGPANVTGGVLVASAVNGISLGTSVSTLAATNTGASGDISIVNTLPLTLDDVVQSAAGGTGSITIDNTGALTVAAAKTISTANGAITLTAHSPLTVNGTVQSTSGPITLTAGSSGQTTDQLTIAAGATVSTSNTVTLVAGNAINIAAGSTVAGSSVTQLSNQNAPPPPPSPSLTDCVANPNLSGCSTVLPSLSQCTADPTLAGCTAVLPTLSQCTATPTLSGCTAVLPSLSDCTTTPTLSGCTAVLPTLSQCTATPTLSGCTAVLPSLSDCTATPTLSGCTAVLPTLNQCTATPTLSGCTAVLPTLSDCTATPTLSGCTAVLPTLSQCTATPTLSGCTAVLPTLSQCTATPTLAGCTTVLPTIGQCTTTPMLAGCSAVLPSLAICTTSPTTAGCTAVLPSLSVCTTSPTTLGCTAVLPSLATCTTSPTTAGCSAVLPSLDSCIATPTLAGCTAVLPTVSQCMANTSLAGCAMVLPALASCIATPTLAGCSVVLPSIDQCTTNLSLAGCTAVLPTIAQCTATPTLAGCSVVMPAASQCTTNSSLPECTTVLPPSTPASTEVVTSTITSTVNTVVTATTQTMSVLPPPTSTTTPKTPAAAGGSASPSPGGTSSSTSASSTSSTSSTSDGSKSEGKKDERKDTAGAKDDGVKKNEPAKKMYCN
ncbi:filamentous hemagglutinin N-terminal domain-containing protein [Noviherbaspirillum sp.]|jgi:filamentous hemagglutinin family protein|uniref:two-partner secretion domain-containing protein n=1 Tax=Noviherbaspirillum sp. TaxID=1926288 RepID=UPI0025DD02CF|nr:filamentous hemagglutinin N-terminal domain-containing protein [Noviherbaspirillum sp.]